MKYGFSVMFETLTFNIIMNYNSFIKEISLYV